MKTLRGEFSGPAGRGQLTIGSDVELARRVLEDLDRVYSSIFFCGGRWWRRNAVGCSPLPVELVADVIREYDGAPIGTASGRARRLRLSHSRVRSIAKEAADQRWRSSRSPDGRLVEAWTRVHGVG